MDLSSADTSACVIGVCNLRLQFSVAAALPYFQAE
jgi:hypothetical protein